MTENVTTPFTGSVNGLNTPAIYLSAKVCVLLAMTLAQSALLIAVVRLRKPGPEGAAWAPDGTLELWLAVFGTAFASALLLLLSAVVTTRAGMVC